jgi:hypothetical protein
MRSARTGIRQVMISLRSCFMRYHPEKHYMRGPGPKTLSKWGGAARGGGEGDLRESRSSWWLRFPLVGIPGRWRNRKPNGDRAHA